MECGGDLGLNHFLNEFQPTLLSASRSRWCLCPSLWGFAGETGSALRFARSGRAGSLRPLRPAAAGPSAAQCPSFSVASLFLSSLWPCQSGLQSPLSVTSLWGSRRTQDVVRVPICWAPPAPSPDHLSRVDVPYFLLLPLFLCFPYFLLLLGQNELGFNIFSAACVSSSLNSWVYPAYFCVYHFIWCFIVVSIFFLWPPFSLSFIIATVSFSPLLSINLEDNLFLVLLVSSTQFIC